MGDHQGVDALELRVAIRIAAAFQGLAIDLPTVLQQPKQLWDAALGNAVSHSMQCIRQLRVALRHPQQRSRRIAHRRGFQQPPQIVEQRRILGDQRMPAAAATPNDAAKRARIIEILQAAADRAARHACGARRSRDPTMPGAARLRRSKQPPASLVQTTTNRRISLANRQSINHGQRICIHHVVPESPISRFRNFWASPNVPPLAPARRASHRQNGRCPAAARTAPGRRTG